MECGRCRSTTTTTGILCDPYFCPSKFQCGQFEKWCRHSSPSEPWFVTSLFIANAKYIDESQILSFSVPLGQTPTITTACLPVQSFVGQRFVHFRFNLSHGIFTKIKLLPIVLVAGWVDGEKMILLPAPIRRFKNKWTFQYFHQPHVNRRYRGHAWDLRLYSIVAHLSVPAAKSEKMRARWVEMVNTAAKNLWWNRTISGRWWFAARVPIEWTLVFGRIGRVGHRLCHNQYSRCLR